MGSSGSQDPTLQLWRPPMQPLMRQTGAGTGAVVGKTTNFRVPIPDSRLRVKVSCMFVYAANATRLAVTGQGATLWLRESEIDDSGTSGDLVPCTDLAGSTQAAPIAIPQSAGLAGFSREFISAADYIEGTLAVATSVASAGYWVLQCRYQPNAVRFTPEEWDSITRGANPYAPSPILQF